MSIDRARLGLRHDDAGRMETGTHERSSRMHEAPDAAQIALNLTEKYGWDALAFARDRAERAVEVGDELALEAWRSVIEATQALLRQMADA